MDPTSSKYHVKESEEDFSWVEVINVKDFKKWKYLIQILDFSRNSKYPLRIFGMTDKYHRIYYIGT